MGFKLLQGDALEMMREMPDESFNAVLCDPPYGLSFMGKEWDHGVPSKEVWAEVLRVLKPGAVLMAFGGTRTWHRLAVAIEDAGFELFDTMMWLYGSGFPKSHNIGKAIDKAAGRNRRTELDFARHIKQIRLAANKTLRQFNDEFGYVAGCNWWESENQTNYRAPNRKDFAVLVAQYGAALQYQPIVNRWHPVGEKIATAVRGPAGFSNEQVPRPWKEHIGESYDITAPATDAAKIWEGYGTSLKPSFEPVIVALKPNPSLTIQELCCILVDEHIHHLLEAAQWQRSNESVGNVGWNSKSKGPKSIGEVDSIAIANASEFHSEKGSGEVAPSVAEGSMPNEVKSKQGRQSIVGSPVPTQNVDCAEQITQTGKVAALCALMDTLPSELPMVGIDLSTMSSWKRSLVATLSHMSKFTIAMKTELITDLSTLNWLLCRLTSESIIQHKSSPTSGCGSFASTVGASLSVAARKWSITLEPFVAANASGSPLVPNWEPILLARKPREATYAQTAMEHGTAALNIDGCRVGYGQKEGPENLRRIDGPDSAPRTAGCYAQDEWTKTQWKRNCIAGHSAGRWPANLLLSHSPECRRVGVKRVKPLEGHRPNPVVKQADGQIKFNEKRPGFQKQSYTDPDGTETVERWICSPQCAVAALDKQSGVRPSVGGWCKGHDGEKSSFGIPTGRRNVNPYAGETGGASRFFKCFEGERFRYQSKASRRERNAGLEGMPLVLGGSLDGGNDTRRGKNKPQLHLVRNFHPTIKPLALCEYLARLILPPEEYRDEAALLVPFCGSGSEIVGGILAGWRNIVGVDIVSEYLKIARLRIDWWLAQMKRTGLIDPRAILKACKKPGQKELGL